MDENHTDLIAGKYALICGMEIQKIQMVVHIFSRFALFTVVAKTKTPEN